MAPPAALTGGAPGVHPAGSSHDPPEEKALPELQRAWERSLHAPPAQTPGTSPVPLPTAEKAGPALSYGLGQTPAQPGFREPGL